MSSTISMQGLTLAATTASEKSKLMLDDVNNARLDVQSGQVTQGQNLDQGLQVIVHVYRVYRGQLLCKI